MMLKYAQDVLNLTVSTIRLYCNKILPIPCMELHYGYGQEPMRSAQKLFVIFGNEMNLIITMHQMRRIGYRML